MRKEVKRISFLFLAIALIFVACSSIDNSSKKEKKEENDSSYKEFIWPDSDLAKLLPKARSNIGKIELDEKYRSNDVLFIYVANTSLKDFKDYINSCIDKGFNYDCESGDNFFKAYNDDKYFLSLRLEEDNIMWVWINSPSDKVFNDEKKNDSEIKDNTFPENYTPPIAEVPPESNLSDKDIRPEIKEDIDNYESFIDEYVEFMENFYPDLYDTWIDYDEYQDKYETKSKEFSEIKNKDLTEDELNYFNEVLTRLKEKEKWLQ